MIRQEGKTAIPLKTGGKPGFWHDLKIKTNFFEVFGLDGVDGLGSMA